MYDLTYVDYSTIRKEGGMVRMWVMDDYKQELELPSGEKLLSIKMQKEFDCMKEKTRNIFASAYSRNMGRGEPVYIENTPSLEWNPVPPGTVREGLWNIACEQTEKDKILREKKKFDFGFYKRMIKYSSFPHIPPPLQAAWVNISQLNKNNSDHHFYPKSYKEGQLIQVWELEKSHNEISTLAWRYKYEYDCVREQVRELYSSSVIINKWGESSDEHFISSEARKWNSVKLGSAADIMLDIICDERG